MVQRRVFLIRRVIALLALLAAAFAIWFALSLWQPFHGPGHGRVTVTIPSGSSTGQIGAILERDGVISSGFFFKLRVALDGDRGRLRAGTYNMRLDMSYAAALQELTGSTTSAMFAVTVIPGRSRAQIQAQLHADGIDGNYVAATLGSRLLDPRRYGAPPRTPSLEGFLWPDTYLLNRPVKLGELIRDQLQRFKQEFAGVNLSYAKSKNLTAYDVLKIASLISGEAMRPRDAPLVASVIYNRLRDGMNLGLDSTVEYATGNYGTLSERDLQSRSPWNTRNHAGLPPTPISNPDLAAIQAAAHPAKTDYVYFINRVCGDGALRFTASYAQFLRWSTDWSNAVAHAQAHGGSPEFCGKHRSRPAAHR